MIKKTLLSVYLALLIAGHSHAGGPENAVVVINEESASSKLIANHYISQRKIPSINVIYLSDIPKGEFITLDDCREQIIIPILREIERRGIANHIDYIIYSSGFPTSVRGYALRDKLRAGGNQQEIRIAGSQVLAPELSLTSATYYYQSILAEDHAFYLSLNSNLYYRGDTKKLMTRPFVGDDQKKYSQALRDARNGETEAAISSLESLANEHPLQTAVPYWLARIHAKNDDAENASIWLKRAVDSGWCYREYTKADVVFSSVQNNEKFKSTVASIPELPFLFLPTQSFRSAYDWGPNGLVNSTPNQGRRYMLSAMLGVNRNQGNSEQETLRYLSRSISADGTKPTGSFYFTTTKDIRTKTRLPNFQSAIDELLQLGYSSEIIAGHLPKNRKDIAGLMIGVANFQWEKSGSTILPGAICENLTSFAGRLMPGIGQTKLSEFLRYGAAGSSGTVREPFALQAKFPHPRIHVHYVRGCTMAEAYYQSVTGPFQLLIVGDALCKPWAVDPKISVSGEVTKEVTLSGTISVALDGSNSPVPIRTTDIYVNGILVNQIEKTGTGPFSIDTSTMPDGYHELRFVPSSDSHVSTRSSVIAPIVVDNSGHRVELQLLSKSVEIDKTISFSATAEGATEIALIHNNRVIDTQQGSTVRFNIPAYNFGRGPVKINAVAAVNKMPVRSKPLALNIRGPISDTLPVVNSPQTPKRKTKPKETKPKPVSKKSN